MKDIRDQIYEGLITGNNKVFYVRKIDAEKLGIEAELLKPVPKGNNVRKYKVSWDDEYVIYPYTELNNKALPLPVENYSKTEAYLAGFRIELKNRPCIKEGRKKWYELCRPRVPNWFNQNKIITPNLASSNNFCVDFANNRSQQYFYVDHDCYGITLQDNDRSNYLYILGLLNSIVVEFFIKKTSPMFSGGYYKYHTQYLDPIPVPKIDNEKQESIKQQIIALVKLVIALNMELQEINEFTDKGNKLMNKIKNVEHQIDERVCELYGLSEAEKSIIIEEIHDPTVNRIRNDPLS